MKRSGRVVVIGAHHIERNQEDVGSPVQISGAKRMCSRLLVDKSQRGVLRLVFDAPGNLLGYGVSRRYTQSQHAQKTSPSHFFAFACGLWRASERRPGIMR